ncbi:MAG: NBR1-Ig-like domain-containing protein [Anaerolineales bacterium]
MKSLSKLASAVLLLALVLGAFPSVGASSAQASTCDWAQFIADVTVPDGTTYTPGATFRKTWRLRNIGHCTWTTSYALVFDSGEQMGAPSAVNFPSNVPPGATVDLSLDMTAPSSAGHYFGYWKLRNANNVLFGIGSTTNRAFWVEIYVGSSSGVGYDFAANAPSATWTSGAGALTFPGTDGDAKGFALKLDKPKFESGIELGNPGLLVAPQNIYNGYIQGIYPAFRVQSGDRFQATIGCEYGATNCYVAYRLDYQIGNGPVRTFWTFREKYEGLTYNVNLNLNALAGQDVKFILFISAYGNASGDRALWGNPVIARVGASPVTPTATVTGTPPTPTPTSTKPPTTSTVPPSTCDKTRFIADVTVPDGTTFAPGAAFNKTWRLKNVGSCNWTTSYQLVFYSGEKMGGPDALTFPKSVAPGQTVDLTVSLTAPNSPGSYRGYWMFKNASGALFGIGTLANKPWWVDIKVSGTVTSTATTTPATATTTSATPTNTPATATPTATTTQTTTANWNTYQNLKYGFNFQFPPGSVVTGQTDTAGRIFFPITSGTNLVEKYLDITVVEDADPCKSPTSGAATSENVTINSISFLKETGSGVATGNIYDWMAYSTTQDNACISMTFVLHSAELENYATPPTPFDSAAESAVFDTIMTTFSLGG